MIPIANSGIEIPSFISTPKEMRALRKISDAIKNKQPDEIEQVEEA